MAIEDLRPRQGNVELVAEVTDIGEVREFQKFGKPGRVCSATIKDATGEMKLSLWNEQIDQVKVGDKIKISNGYVNEWQGERQLTTGKFGKLEVMSSSGEVQEPADEPMPPEETPEEAADEPLEETPDVEEEKVE